MKFLLDTHLLLWAAGSPDRISRSARTLLNSPENDLFFSAASIWEIAIKSGLKRNDFQVNARLLYHGLLDNGYNELSVTGEHSVAVDLLPALHKDPFDRILIAQAMVEGITLLTADPVVASYSGSIRKI